MRMFVRAVVSGFGFSLGSALFKRVSSRLGLDEPEEKAEKAEPDGAEVGLGDDDGSDDGGE